MTIAPTVGPLVVDACTLAHQVEFIAARRAGGPSVAGGAVVGESQRAVRREGEAEGVAQAGGPDGTPGAVGGESDHLATQIVGDLCCGGVVVLADGREESAVEGVDRQPAALVAAVRTGR